MNAAMLLKTQRRILSHTLLQPTSLSVGSHGFRVASLRGSQEGCKCTRHALHVALHECLFSLWEWD